jgi:hypothetical protein
MLTAAAIAGIVAGLGSIPHCAGMCGPLAGFACSRVPSAGRDALGLPAPVRYQLGRLFAYAGAGALAGGLGGALAAPLADPWARALVSWTLAAALLWTALRFWRLAEPSRPAFAGSFVATGRLLSRRSSSGGGIPPTASSAPPARSAPAGAGWFSRLLGWLPRDAALVGALTALLPCGALYAGLAIAAGTGDPLGGAVAMAAFALASGLGVLGASAVAQRLRTLQRPAALRVLAVVLALGGLVLALRPVGSLRDEPVLCHDPSPADDVR